MCSLQWPAASAGKSGVDRGDKQAATQGPFPFNDLGDLTFDPHLLGHSISTNEFLNTVKPGDAAALPNSSNAAPPKGPSATLFSLPQVWCARCFCALLCTYPTAGPRASLYATHTSLCTRHPQINVNMSAAS